MKLITRLPTVLLFCGAFSLTPSLPAATLHWDGATISPNADGGSGLWNTTDPNWDNASIGGADSVWSNVSPDFGVFGGGAGTVTLGENITVSGLQFNTSGYTINTDVNTLSFGAADNVIRFNGVATATLTGGVGGAGNLTISSLAPTAASTLTLNGPSTGGWSGSTTVNARTTLALAGLNQGLLSTTGVILLNGGGVRLTNTATEATLDRVAEIPLIANGGTFTYANTATASTAYGETIGAATLLNGQLNFVLSANQSLSGNTQTFTLGGLTQLGSSAVTFSALTTAPNATTNRIVVTGATPTSAGQIIGPWATTGTDVNTQTDYAIYNASSQVVPSGMVNSGQTTWTDPTLAYVGNTGAAITLTGLRQVAALQFLGTSATLALDAFNLETQGLLFPGANAMTVSSAGGVLTTASGGGNLFITTGRSAITHTISAPINDNGGAVTVVKSGAGILTLSNTTSNFSGGVVINGGKFISSAGLASVGSGSADIVFNGSAQWQPFSGSSTRGVVLNNGSFVELGGNGTYTFTGNVTGSGGIAASPFNFGSNVFLNGTANTFEGPIVIGAGSGTGGQSFGVTLASLADSTTARGRIVMAGNVTHGTNASVFGYTGSANVILSNRQIELASNLANPTNGHQVRSNGTGTLTVKTDLLVTTAVPQTLTLRGSNTGANTFAGAIPNSSAPADTTVLAVPFTTTPTSTITLASVTGIVSGAAITGTGIAPGTTVSTVNPATRVVTLSAPTNGTAGVAGQIMTVAGVINPVSLTKLDAGLWNLAGTNTYRGPTVNGFSNPAGAGLVFQGIQALSPNTTLSQTHPGGVGGFGVMKILDDAAAPASRTGVHLTMASSNTTHALTLFVGNNGFGNGGNGTGGTTGSTIALGNLTMNQTVVGNTSQTFSPTGANGYKLQINDILLNTNVGLTAWSGVLNPTSAPLIVAGNVTQTNAHPTVSATLQLDGTANGNQINGIISDAASGAPLRLTKSNSSTWSLSGANSYTGATTISAGTLIVNGNQSTATGAVAVNGTSTLGGTGKLGGTVTVAAGANLAPGVASAGTLSIAGDLNISAPVDGGSGKLRFDLGPVAASDRIAVTGVLSIGTDKLEFSDFVFTPLIGLNNGTYKLITSSSISGTLDAVSANLTGAIGVGTGTLQMNGNDIELVVTGFGGLAGYSLWASTNAPSTTPSQDQDGDGVSNAVEYVLGGTIGSNDLGKLPGISTAGGNMIFSFKRDQASIDGTTVVSVEVGTDLTNWPSPSPYAVPDVATANNPGITVIKDLPTGFDTITLTLPQASDSKKFARLKVVVTP